MAKKTRKQIEKIMFAYPTYAQQQNKSPLDDPGGDGNATITPAFDTRPDYDPFYTDFIDFLTSAPNNVSGTFPKNMMQTIKRWKAWILWAYECQNEDE